MIGRFGRGWYWQAAWLAVGAVGVSAAAGACSSDGRNGDLGGGDFTSSGPQSAACDGRPRSGCACTAGGERARCGRVVANLGAQVMCGQGEMICGNGTWGECIINNTIGLVLASGIEPKSKVQSGIGIQGLGPPSACTDPCDPSCETFVDTTAGLDAGTGLVTNDSGISLLPGAPVVPPPSCTGGAPLGTCSHSICSVGATMPGSCNSCVASVCAVMPSCCAGATDAGASDSGAADSGSATGWNAACIAQAATTCNIKCNVGTGGACVVCYKDNIDHDGDGYSFAQGDCLDCDSNVNPGAYDFPGNNIDEDCNGTVDDPTSVCDNGITLTSSTANDYAKAMGLCKFTTSSATGTAKTWGVLTDGTNAAKLAQADGTSVPHASSYAVMPNFGPNNLPREGNALAVFSSGTARRPGDTGFKDPSGQVSGSFNQGKSCAFPAGFPKNKTGCAAGSATAYDSSGLVMKIRVPTNAQSFAYNFHFFSSEYPEWVCTAYNDSFVALLTGLSPQNPLNSKNISFDSANNPVNVNVGFFTIPGSPTATSPILTGTGYDGTCSATGSYPGPATCGGSTNWLRTTAPVVPGETITMQFAMWDTGDQVWDSTVLLDNWQWSANPATIQTLPDPPPPAPTYNPASFVRDYDASTVCPDGTVPRWGLWSWTTTTVGDSQVEFYIRTSDTAAGLNTATEYPLRFSNPPGPAALSGTSAIARTSPTDTRSGSANVDATLLAVGAIRYNPYMRVISKLIPTTNKLAAPTLGSWNLQVSCPAAE